MTWLLLTLLLQVLLAELLGWFPWLAKRLILRAVRALPPPERGRWEEEWLGDLDRMPGPGISKLVFALVVLCHSQAMVAAVETPSILDNDVAPEKIHRLRNWTRRVEPSETVADTRRRLGWHEDEFICLHGGNLGRKQGLDNLLDTAALLREERVRIVLSGDGNDRRRLEERARELSLDNVQFIELQGPGRWEAVMEASSLLLVNQRPSVTDMSLPSKLTSYFAANRPVVAAASADSETAREIEAAGAGYVVPPDDAHALRDAILSVKSNGAGGRLGASARRYAETTLLPATALAEYDSFLAVALNGSRPGRVRALVRLLARLLRTRGSAGRRPRRR